MRKQPRHKQQTLKRIVLRSKPIWSKNADRVQENGVVFVPAGTNRLTNEVTQARIRARRSPLHGLGAAPSGRPSPCLIHFALAWGRPIEAKDIVQPLLVSCSEINDERLVHLPVREDWVAFPILNIVLRPVDDSTCQVCSNAHAAACSTS